MIMVDPKSRAENARAAMMAETGVTQGAVEPKTRARNARTAGDESPWYTANYMPPPEESLRYSIKRALDGYKGDPATAAQILRDEADRVLREDARYSPADEKVQQVLDAAVIAIGAKAMKVV